MNCQLLKLKIIISLSMFFLCFAVLSAQDVDTDSSNTRLSDTVCYKYDFHAGDTLYYYVVAFDSIIIDYETPLLKNRLERIRITCDSVSKEGHFFLTHSLVEFIGKDSRGDIKGVTRTTSPWIGRKVWIEIDSLGKRYSFGVDDSSKGTMSPGGAFQPFLIFSIGESCKKINESWIVEDTISVPENGVPTPVWRNTSLCRAKAPFDTLGENCTRLEFINTGQGVINLISDDSNMRVNSIFNGYGCLSISSTNHIPLHLFATIELKLKIMMPGGVEKPGWHYININYTLDRLFSMSNEQ